MKQPSSQNQPGLLTGIAILIVLAALVTAVLALTDAATAERRQQNQAVYAARLLRDVIPAGDYRPEPGAVVVRVQDAETLGTTASLPAYPLYRDAQNSGVVLTVQAPNGYVAPLTLLVGIDTTGRITGVRVTEHRETPGLGDKVERARSDWITVFAGRTHDTSTAAPWALKRDGGDIDHISGATITSRAVVNAVGNALRYYNAHRTELLIPVASTESSTVGAAPTR